ncbi:hypothetical protein QJS04_geneDACA001838 [Acorus gramineus]|uniref:Uncharacterized protein n=1 Tax=Acorus gramineus TaxID=55184 RepID=A0AAV9BHD8_ACOGR|nr:hypothetical protein QJS04_geneDACA001838 [Acorus gramineus]
MYPQHSPDQMGSSFPWRFIVWLILGLLALNGLVSGCEARMSFPKQTEVAHLHHISGDVVIGFGEIKRINPQLPPSPMANCPWGTMKCRFPPPN